MYQKILLVDCDGTIRKPKSAGAKFISRPDDQEPIPGAIKAINHYKAQGWNIVVGISNQGGVGAGHKTLDNCIEEQQFTLGLFPQLNRIYFCPDYKGDICYSVSQESFSSLTIRYDGQYCGQYRKPEPGMIFVALTEYLTESKDNALMVGDRPEDEAAAAAAGISFMWANVWRSSICY